MQRPVKAYLIDWLRSQQPAEVLDCPAGNGWLVDALPESAVDGIDLYARTDSPYRRHLAANLDHGIPAELPVYDLVACCEGIEHFGNPELFLRRAFEHVKPGGQVLVTTPNTWHPGAKLQYGTRGFFPGFPCLVGKIEHGAHMHILPWSFPQLYLFLTLCGFTDIRLHDQPLSRPKHLYEYLLAVPQALYCRRRARQAGSDEERSFWQQAGSRASRVGRHLIVTARRPER